MPDHPKVLRMLSQVTTSSHAISRSTELLSVARTSLRVLQQDPDISPDILSLAANDLTLHPKLVPSNAAIEALDEASLTFNLLDSTLKSLSELVKRRGTTNDPTEEINRSIGNINLYSKGILEIIQNSIPQSSMLSPYDDTIVRSSSQRARHYEFVASVLKTRVEKRMEEFKGIMEVRGNVIKDQALRRKQLLNGNKARHNVGQMSQAKKSIPMAPKSGGVRVSKGFPSVGIDRNRKSQMNSPLFTMSHGQAKSNSTIKHRQSNASGKAVQSRQQQTAPSLYSAPQNIGYGGSAAYGGGGGGYGNENNAYSAKNMGMRRRAGGPNETNTFNPYQEEENKIHDTNSVQAQIQMRRENRQTKKRLESAREAEKSLAELTTMFSKMTNLIHSQGETLVKIEDDVEAAMDHVEAGREEIVKLYEWTKGNRGLIVKIFAILIFFIVFTRFYG